MSMNFRDVAKKKLADVERPPLPPVGHYIFLITKQPSIETLKGDEWDVVDFVMKGIAPSEDVDMEALAAYGDVTRIVMRHRFMFNKNDENEFNRSLFNMRRFLEEHVKCATPDMDLTTAMNAAVNNQVMAQVVWKADKNDAELMHANIGRTAPVA